jgi:hypothetical protein
MPLEGVGCCGGTSAKWSRPYNCHFTEGENICCVFVAYHKYHKTSWNYFLSTTSSSSS